MFNKISIFLFTLLPISLILGNFAINLNILIIDILAIYLCFIKRNNSLEAYGSGIVSSIKESQHALSTNAEVKQLNLLDVFRTLYRIDIVQPIYFYIESFEELYNLVDDSKMVFDSILEAKAKGPFVPKFEVEDLPEDDFRKKLVRSLA